MSEAVFTNRAAKAVAEATRQTLSTSRNSEPLRRSPRHVSGSRILKCKAPAGGIAARAADVCTAGTCKVYYLDEDDTLAVYQQDGADVEISVFNTFGQAITASAFIYATQEQVSGRWVVLAEDCP